MIERIKQRLLRWYEGEPDELDRKLAESDTTLEENKQMAEIHRRTLEVLTGRRVSRVPIRTKER